MRTWKDPCSNVWSAVTRIRHPRPSSRSFGVGAVRIADLLSTQPTNDSTGPDVTVHGFVRSVRKQKRVAFAAIGDGSTLDALQIVLNPQDADILSNGAAVTVTGKWTASLAGKKQANELQVRDVQVLGENNAASYPIQKKYHTSEFLRTLPHLRARIPFNALLLQLRSQIIASATQFFSERGFVQTHTPILTSSDCEGAGEVFAVERPNSDAITTSALPSDTVVPSFFRTTKYLTVSSQLHLEALAQAVGKVWTLSPSFRAEESDTARHLSEFYMLEAEVAFVDDLSCIMDIVEDLIRFCVSKLVDSDIGLQLLRARNHAHDDQEQIRQSSSLNPDDLSHRWTKLIHKPWPRITYHQACQILQTAVLEGKATFDEEADPHNGLQTEHERYLAEHIGHSGPVFVTNYPAAAKPFYMAPSKGDEEDAGPVPTVACFDLLLPDVCEVVGGSMREHRLSNLEEAMRQKGLINSTDPGKGSLDWYVDLRRYGSLPHGGFGLGFDRLLGFLAGVSNIRDVVAFPRHYGRCLC